MTILWAEQEKIILEEVIPLAKTKGFDFSTEDFQKLLQPAKKQLTDEELIKRLGVEGNLLIKIKEEKMRSKEQAIRFSCLKERVCSL